MNAVPLSKRYRRVVELQLNELSRPIVDAMVREGELPNFAFLDRDWRKLQTTSETAYEHLEPWIQWTSRHTGKTFKEHGVFRLGDSRAHHMPQTWEVLSDHGIESAILGSMNAHRGSARGGVFFPDPWAKQNDAYPESLRPLWTLISRQVQGHAVAQPTVVDAFRGAAAAIGLRISPRLQAQIAMQVVKQRFDRRTAWRMAGLFDLFLFEAFRHILETTRFGFYTLFLNAIAHYQHHFWRQFDRSGFDARITCPDCHTGDDPIRYGYRLYDSILGEVRALCSDPDTLVVVLTGLSQTAFKKKENEGGMNYWRLRDHRGFAAQIGLRGEVFPLMSRDWQIGFASDSALETGRALLAGLSVGGEQLFSIDRNQANALFLETAVTRAVAPGTPIVDAAGQSVGDFHAVFARTAVKSGHHTGTGLLWLSDPAPSATVVPLTSVHGTTLEALGVTRSHHTLDAVRAS